MGVVSLKQLMSTQQRERRRQRVQARDGSVTSVFQPNKYTSYSGPNIPEDIWCRIHSLMPIQDSARAACVSRAFLYSWRQRPNLIINKQTLGFKQIVSAKRDITRSFASTVDQILKKRSGTGVKTLELDISGCCNLNTCCLNNWLRITITPGIENLTLWLPRDYKVEYSFPCSLLFGGNGSWIRHLHLTYCAFRPTLDTVCLRSLTELHLHEVCITGEELGFVLSNSLALKQLELSVCCEIICLKIPCVLEQFSSLAVFECSMLQMIESKAPNLSTINFEGGLVQLSLGQSSQVKEVDMECPDETNFLSYVITKLPHIVPNLETLTISSHIEMASTPMTAAKFLKLKHLEIRLGPRLCSGYDFLSLVSFLDASPVLETFILAVEQDSMNSDSVFRDALHMTQVPGHIYDRLKDVKIFGFCSAKGMVELTCHIMEGARNLERITLDCVFDDNDNDDVGRCSVATDREPDSCTALFDEMILEAEKGLMAIQCFIMEKVPSTVKLDVRGPCSRCHTLGR